MWNALTRLFRKLGPVFATLWNAVTSHAALTIFGLLLLIAAFPIVGLLLWPFLQHTMKPSDFDERKEVIVLLVQGLAVLGGAAALLFTWLRLRAAERTIEISQEGQITERFTRAIQQLGDRKLEVRLGGIYALERIARDSPRDHWTIMEVLTAYVRENARWKGEAAPAQPAGQTGTPAQSSDAAPPSPDVKPRADIRAILTVLGRRPEKARKEEGRSNRILDLRGTDLRGADLTGAHMEGAYLIGAHMERAKLRFAHMEGANLRDAHMEGAELWAAHMEGAYLRAAHMKGADLIGAHMEGAILRGAHMEGADLRGAHMEGANLRDAHMERAMLWDAHMEGADLSYAVGLTREQLALAITDKDTILPDYLKEQGSAPPSSP